MNATLTLLTALLLTAPAALRAADVQGQERVKLRLGFADDADLKVIGNVKVGIALEGDELAASLARDGDGKVARFEGGRLLAGDAKPVLKGMQDFTFYLRLKSEGDGLHGTVLAQRQPGRQGSCGFDVSGWHMPFIEREHFGFQGMFEGGLPPNAGPWSRS